VVPDGSFLIALSQMFPEPVANVPSIGQDVPPSRQDVTSLGPLLEDILSLEREGLAGTAARLTRYSFGRFLVAGVTKTRAPSFSSSAMMRFAWRSE
jgi:hypothetical protein